VEKLKVWYYTYKDTMLFKGVAWALVGAGVLSYVIVKRPFGKKGVRKVKH
jgi:hypothetical protein